MVSVRAQRALEAPEVEPDDGRWPFPCAWVCGVCGYLRRPEDRHSPHPLRTDADLDAGVRTPCGHCHAPASSAVDLADKAMARSLIDGELHDQQHAPSVLPVVGQVVAGAVTAGVGAALLASGVGLVVGVASLGSAGIAWAKAASDLKTLRGRTRAPRRWFHAPRPEGPLHGHGEVELRGEPVRAPLSGRACLAYEVRVLWAQGDPADPCTAALVEQAIGTLRPLEPLEPLDNAIERPQMFLELPAARIEPREFSESESARIYLASRGLTTTDGEFIFFEAIVTAQTRVEVLWDAEGAVLLRSRTTAHDGR